MVSGKEEDLARKFGGVMAGLRMKCVLLGGPRVGKTALAQGKGSVECVCVWSVCVECGVCVCGVWSVE